MKDITTKTRVVRAGNVKIGGGNPLAFICGPCVIESETLCMAVAEKIKLISEKHKLPVIFKASFDKANRTSIGSFRGQGLREGLRILKKVKETFHLPVLSDVHDVTQVQASADVLDVLQVPAFLCRQTDLLVACAKTKKTVNVKKGQFLSPWEMKNAVDKILAHGNKNILLTERGTTFGYNYLVVDMCSLPVLRGFSFPVVFDATHSVQNPGGAKTFSSGRREFIVPLSRAAVACGVDAVFMETHPRPEKALSDSATSFPLENLESFMRGLAALHAFSTGKQREKTS